MYVWTRPREKLFKIFHSVVILHTDPKYTHAPTGPKDINEGMER